MAINTKPHIHKIIICANMFVRKDGKYLMLRRSPLKKYCPNYIHPIGGKVDPGENPYITAQRELFEEAGIRVKNVRLEATLLEIKPVKGEVHDWLVFHFSGDFESGVLQTTEEGAFVWLSPAQIVQEQLFPSVQKAIFHILNPHDGPLFATFRYDEEGNIIDGSEEMDVCMR